MHYSVDVYDGINGEEIEKVQGDCLSDLLQEKVLSIILNMRIKYGQCIVFELYKKQKADHEWKTIKLTDIIRVREK
jgi:hypothetical protein